MLREILLLSQREPDWVKLVCIGIDSSIVPFPAKGVTLILLPAMKLRLHYCNT